MNNIYSLNEIKLKLAPIFVEYDITKAILFGSYAKGQATESSDIDLVIDCKQRGLSFYSIVAAIEDGLKKECDVFRATSIKRGSRLSEEIEETGVIIYEH